RQLAERSYLASDEYTIADMAAWPWYGELVRNNVYEAAEFLSAHEYPHLLRWADDIAKRPAVMRGQRVNRVWGEETSQVAERHGASDVESGSARLRGVSRDNCNIKDFRNKRRRMRSKKGLINKRWIRTKGVEKRDKRKGVKN